MAQTKEPMKMTVYLPLELVDALDLLKIEDQQERVSRNMTRPAYVVWALQRYVEERKRKK